MVELAQHGEDTHHPEPRCVRANAERDATATNNTLQRSGFLRVGSPELVGV